jgi:pimeloyl-ACP methyl ester carboxylesterase
MLDAKNPKPFPPAVVDRMYDDIDAGTKRAILALYRATSDIDGMTARLVAKLAPLHLPALVLWGAADAFLPARFAEMQRRFFGEVDVHVLEGAGHWPFIDEPERVASLVIPYLQKQVGTSAPGVNHVS